MLSDTILKTKLLEFDKSSFLIDLKETSNGQKYLEITQTIFQGSNEKRSSIKINPKILNTLVATLLEFDGQEDKAIAIPKDQYGQDLEKIKSAYWKGSTLESLTLQFQQYSVAEMENMLRENGVAIVNQSYTPPKSKRNFTPQFRKK